MQWYFYLKRSFKDKEDITDQNFGHLCLGALYEPTTLTSIQRSLDRHFTKDNHKPYSIIRDMEFSSSQQLVTASKKMLKKEGNGNKSKASQPLPSHTVLYFTIMCF